MGTVLLDSSVFLDYFLKGRQREKSKRFMEQLAHRRIRGIISTNCLLEVKYHITKEQGHERAEEVLFFIKTIGNMEIVFVSDGIAETAADIRMKYYDRKEKPLSFADAIHIATAIQKNCSKIVTADSDFKNIREMPTEVY